MCRRLSFSPDGLLLITPTGIHRPPSDAPAKGSGAVASSSAQKTSSAAPAAVAGPAKSFCTHIYSRNQLSTPCLSLTGLDEPSVAVRCCPRLFKLAPSENASLIPGDYR